MNEDKVYDFVEFYATKNLCEIYMMSQGGAWNRLDFFCFYHRELEGELQGEGVGKFFLIRKISPSLCLRQNFATAKKNLLSISNIVFFTLT